MTESRVGVIRGDGGPPIEDELHNGGTTRFVKGVVTESQMGLRATDNAVVCAGLGDWWSGVEMEMEPRSSRETTTISISHRSQWNDKRPLVVVDDDFM